MIYPNGYDANVGTFEALLSQKDAVIADQWSHPSIEDGISLTKAAKYKFKHNDIHSLQQELTKAKESRIKLVVTQGVFEQDGGCAPLDLISQTCKKNDALLMIDDCLGVGVVGERGRGSAEKFGIHHELVLINSSFGTGKICQLVALGGGSGGYSTGSREVIDLLRQKGRPYIFSNSIAPLMVGAALKATQILSKDHSVIQKLRSNISLIKQLMTNIPMNGDPESPILVFLLPSAQKVEEIYEQFIKQGIWVVADHKRRAVRMNILACHSVQHLRKVSERVEMLLA